MLSGRGWLLVCAASRALLPTQCSPWVLWVRPAGCGLLHCAQIGSCQQAQLATLSSLWMLSAWCGLAALCSSWVLSAGQGVGLPECQRSLAASPACCGCVRTACCTHGLLGWMWQALGWVLWCWLPLPSASRQAAAFSIEIVKGHCFPLRMGCAPGFGAC